MHCLLVFIFRDVRNVHRKTSFGPTIYVTSFFGWTFDSTRFKCPEQIFPINSLSKTDRQTFDRLVKSFGNPNKKLNIKYYKDQKRNSQSIKTDWEKIVPNK